MLKKESTKRIALTAGLCFCINLPAPAFADLKSNSEKLQGEVEQAAPTNNYLKGLVQQEDLPANKENPTADSADPDAQDKELMIEWDRWRNRFLQAVLSGTTDTLSSDQAQNFQFNPQTNIIESKYPIGTTAWFSCKISKDGQVSEVLIEHPSGFPAYDEAVREAVKSLVGSAILKFPSRSKRISVLQAGGVVRAAQASKQYFHFGDTEHYRVPAN